MRKTITTLFTLVICFGLFSVTALGQGSELPSEIWSKVMIDQDYTGTGNAGYEYVPSKKGTQFYDTKFGTYVVQPNFRPYPNANSTQSELSIDVHPTNENIIFGSANTTNWPVTTLYGTGGYISLDGGTTWPNSFDIPPYGSNSGDPVSIIGTNGYFYEGFISNSGGQGIARSTDFGNTWTTYTVAPNPGSLADKNHMMIDKMAGSPFENRLYDGWTPFGGSNDYDVIVTYSSDFGQTWSSRMNVSSTLSGTYLNQGINIQTGPNGEVYAAWAVYDDSNVSSGEDRIGFNMSTDGGASWGTATAAHDETNFGIRGSLFSTGIRTNSFPSMAVDRSGGPYNGRIYIVFTQDDAPPAGSDPDILFVSSDDNGATWSSPVRINDDPMNNGKNQYFPWVTVDQSSGAVHCVFYDSRYTTSDSAGVTVATSLNGGGTWVNMQVSDQNFKPKPIPGLAGGYQGDYIGIAAHNSTVYPFWADDRTGNYQAWMTVLSSGTPCPIDAASNPDPAAGEQDVDINLQQLTWDNGPDALENELYFGESPTNMQLVQSGSLASSWNIPAGTLEYMTTYYWQVIEIGDTCETAGSIWSFTTMQDPNLVENCVFDDDFTAGTGNWNITNDGGDCVWEIHQASEYDMPPDAQGNVMSADADACGSGTSTLTTATLITPLDLSLYTEALWIEFDNDFRTIDSDDESYVEISTDGGSTWVTVWSVLGSSLRNSHEMVDILNDAGGESAVLIRLRSIQPGWDWWWAVDNFKVCGQYIIPVELVSFTADVYENNVTLNWTTATETNNSGFEVQRKTVDSEDYEKVSFIDGQGTTTEVSTYSFVDEKVEAGDYVYRLKQIDFDGTVSYSNQVEVEVEIPKEFALEQNYPNPFNPATVIKYSIPEAGQVNLSVYNVLGEKVTVLVNETKEAGRYEVNFDASQLSSGIYFYKLESGNQVSVKKMMLMK